ncbi:MULTISPECIES: aldo/keto reductase [unclassified Erythrobacter]|uniref:aldo/keto reductase n=1 Tax=unclassified Erythrobacter TaxID=2633097 RepID=UPI000A8A7BBB|nr:MULTISPECIES: aldo/keto reductase [unclassified Erythrobacter]
MPDMPLVGSAKIPAIGFGTFRMKEGEAHKMTLAAIKAGYRHIDTAKAYENEKEVGQAIADSSVPREDIFLTSKILPEDFGHEQFLTAAKSSLENLETDFLDLLLLHWPSKEVPLGETMAAANELVEQGLVRHIGVSNFTISMFDEALLLLDTPLAANQIEFHPFIDQSKVLTHLVKNGVAFEAYAPLAQGRVANDPLLQEIAEKHEATAVQVALAWILSKPNAVVLPKTATPDRLASNLAAIEVALTQDELQRIDELQEQNLRFVSPETLAPEWD